MMSLAQFLTIPAVLSIAIAHLAAPAAAAPCQNGRTHSSQRTVVRTAIGHAQPAVVHTIAFQEAKKDIVDTAVAAGSFKTLAAALGAGQAKAEPGSRLGGGFLELLITGRDPTPRPWLNGPVQAPAAAPAPARMAAPSTAPVPLAAPTRPVPGVRSAAVAHAERRPVRRELGAFQFFCGSQTVGLTCVHAKLHVSRNPQVSWRDDSVNSVF
jgi:hypothetical protein